LESFYYIRSLEEASPSAIFILPHCDDEFYFVPIIRQEISEGANVIVIFTTYGSSYGVNHEIRLGESINALTKIGVCQSSIYNLGLELKVFDGSSHVFLNELLQGSKRLVAQWRIKKFYCFAWEGGHPDHDASHLITVALEKIVGSERGVIEVSGYNSYKTKGPFFRVMTLIPSKNNKIQYLRIPLSDSLSHMCISLHYKSQWKTFLGLFVQNFFTLVILRQFPYRKVGARLYSNPPHEGRLFYERRFGITFQEFYSSTKNFVDKYIGIA